MNDWRKPLLFFSIIAMMATFFLSRAALSISMGLFVVLSFWHADIKKHLSAFFSSPLLWGMSLLFVLPLISGLWSEDKKEWLSVLRLKLPLIVLPLAFAGPFNFSKKQWDGLAYIFIGLTTAASIWSMFHYAGNMDSINESYLKAKSIATLLGNDHVRFSWVVSVVILLSGWMWWKNRSNKISSLLCLLAGCWLIVFLHLLAARTGLFSFYIILLVTGTWLIIKKTKRLQGSLLLILVLALPFLSYLLFPSFQNRVKYISYDYSYFKNLNYLPGGNDVSRVISIRAGWNLLKENPVAGTGAGDIYNETKKWDRKQYPEILDSDMLYPSSEWLIYGLVCGWLGVLIFTGIILVPFLTRRKPYMVWALLNLTAAFSFLFDMGLEVQYGVFAYSFIVLWWWKWLKPQKETASER
ncbi:MAG: O-antigen ligase family protein [Chitinophagaceae bacterium]